MINLYFFLKFKPQLSRTRPDIVRQVDESLIRAITDAGGKITGERSVISAIFYEDTIGFWLDMYILIENLKKAIDSSNDFFGFSLVISSDLQETPEQFCRYLTSTGGGIFIDAKEIKKFIPYAIFEKPSEWNKGRKVRKNGSNNFYRIKELKVFKRPEKDNKEVLNDVISEFEKNKEKNLLVLGSAFLPIHSGLHSYIEKMNGDFPPLTICFGSIGLGAFVDAWSPGIRSLLGGEQSAAGASVPQINEEISRLWELLFRDRIRDEVSDFIVRCVKQFLSLLFEYYFAAAKKRKRAPVIVMENIHLAGKKVTDLLFDSLDEISDENRQKLLILGTGDNEIPPEKLQQWGSVFDNVKNIENKDKKPQYFPKLSAELWEIIYAVSLFGRYFSPELFQRLFEEEEKNPVMIARAFSILHMLGVIDNPREPRLLNRYFEEHARRILADKVERVKAMVRGRLLSWAAKRNITPCFRLLTIISGLDGAKQIDDLLLLKSVSSDITNETITGLELAMKNGQLEELISDKRADAIRYIYKTSKALHTGNEKEINEAFLETPVECEDSPVLKSQMIVNNCGFYLGRHDSVAAKEKSKEAILLGQNKNQFCLPQAYRLFSLVCLTQQQASETIEYLGFALANAERTGNYHEMGITAYYAATAQFLYGDIYNAQKLAAKSVDQSIAAGRPDWADRARFLEGRLAFELGHYCEACDTFEMIRKKPFGNMTEEKDILLTAWIYRSKIYFLDTATIKPSPANHDADLFEIEAAYLAGHYKRAVELSGVLTNPFSKEKFLYTEQPNWSSGFAQCEHLFFPQGEIQDRMICLFHSLALSRLSAEESEEALKEIQRILRYERLCEMDPWDAYYFYAKYRILEQTDASLVDMSTAVSMAFKRLQRRASRIEDIETRRQYLNGSRWNRELSLAAKEFKLI
ncbi:MAG: hypothetical protein LBQ82_04385 [Treponema sp.]|jgi:tetratricopeptide (TPR) repeat protein|nr:hypothetical protein [Treponema sp.]